MASEIEIYNAALVHLGAARAMDPTGPGEHVVTAAEAWPSVRDAVMRAHPWNCALARASLAADATAPAFGYAFAYTLPADPFCLRPLALADSDAAWVVEGRQILTDQAAPLKLRFIRRVTDPAEFDPLLTRALAARLAHAIAYKVNKSRTLKADMWKLYGDTLAEARSIDGMEGTPGQPFADEFLEARI